MNGTIETTAAIRSHDAWCRWLETRGLYVLDKAHRDCRTAGGACVAKPSKADK